MVFEIVVGILVFLRVLIMVFIGIVVKYVVGVFLKMGLFFGL